MKVKVTSTAMDCSLPGSSVHGILQVKILEWVAIPSSRESSPTRYWTHVACIAGRCSTFWDTKEDSLTHNHHLCKLSLWLWTELPSGLPQFPHLGFPCGSAGKASACNAGDLGLIPGLGRSPEEGKGYPLQYSGLENSMDCIVHGVAKSQTQLSDFHFTSISPLNN